LICCGIDWAERTHDVALVADSGQLLAKRHITDDAAGYKVLLDLLAEYGDTEEHPIPVAIETSCGLLVAVLRQGKRKVFAINPMAALPLPRPAQRLPQEVRSGRRPGAREHPAHRHARPPGLAR
jgi:transposase